MNLIKPSDALKARAKSLLNGSTVQVLKAAKKPAVLPFASFMAGVGRTSFNIASSLHSSRLAAFGFTAEARVRGITHYQISEQLDGRTCEVCRHMHGKVFQVADARGFLDTVVRTQEVSELKMLQPWPDQSAAGIEAFKKLSTEELTIGGWHVPPYHPRCRGMLVKAGNAPQLDATPSPPKPPYVATKEDFKQLGVPQSPKGIETWNRVMKSPPAEVVAGLTGKPTEQILQLAATADDPQAALGLTLRTTPNFVRLEMESIAHGSKNPVKQDYFFKKDGDLSVGLVEFLQGDEGLIKKVFRGLYGVAKNTITKRIHVTTGDDLGGYAYAKYGFSLNKSQWTMVKAQIKDTINNSYIMNFASEVEKKAVYLILNSTDPNDIFALSDIPNVGKALLSGTSWNGVLDFEDAEAMTRFLTFVG